jgi:F-box-like
VLPDDVLLVIFYFYVDPDEAYFSAEDVEEWQTLVHVCRRWRSIVFGSPSRLNLRLVCTPYTPVEDLLDVWPALPFFIWGYTDESDYTTESVDNITALLEHSDRVCNIDLRDIPNSHLESISAAMQVPFPNLTDLVLISSDKTVTVFPDSFLGGCTPRLEFLLLRPTPFSGFPKLLLFSTHLNDLRLYLPHSGYIPPEAMVTAISTLASLEIFVLEFQSPLSLPDRESRRPPPSTRNIFPVLKYYSFKGVSEYLDDVVARIDAPLINELSISLFNQIEFDTPQFIKFISRTPRFKAFKIVHIFFKYDHGGVKLVPETSRYSETNVNVSIPCRELDWQISSLEQVFTSCLPSLSTLEDLIIYEHPHLSLQWPENIENALLLELLHPFPSVKHLYLSGQVAPHIGLALQELVGTRTMEVLPTLEYIFLEEIQPSGPVPEGIEQFAAARQVASHPIAVSRWESAGQD